MCVCGGLYKEGVWHRLGKAGGEGAWYTECELEMMQTKGGNLLWELNCAEHL